MTITLPDEVRAQAERQAKAGGFASVADYLADLVREDGDVVERDGPNTAHTREDVERLLNEALGDKVLVADEAFWERHRQRLLAKAGERGQTP
jgi:Arc/MetJ-type ribon-helix-helix transcriptional regulator